MPKYKGAEARYDVITARVNTAGRDRVQRFADERKIGISSAAAMLMMLGLEWMECREAQDSARAR